MGVYVGLLKHRNISQTWQDKLAIPVTQGGWRQEDCRELEASLRYTARLGLIKPKQKKEEEKKPKPAMLWRLWWDGRMDAEQKGLC